VLSGTSKKKSVRFQVYDAKNMSALRQMRFAMQEKFDYIKERERTSLSYERGRTH